MASEKYQLTRRKFMIAGSTSMAAPILTTMPGVGRIQKAEAAGVYNATIRYESTGLENGSPMNGANVKVKLLVE